MLRCPSQMLARASTATRKSVPWGCCNEAQDTRSLPVQETVRHAEMQIHSPAWAATRKRGGQERTGGQEAEEGRLRCMQKPKRVPPSRRPTPCR
eukprot:3931790-Rhodomonas_salina.1